MIFRSFRDILGQHQATTLLSQALKKNKLAHAYLFYGPKGVGKKTTAKAFLFHLFCLLYPDDPCGSCLACKKLEKEIHPDVYRVLPELRDIRIDTIRAVERFLRTGPLEAPYKVILMYEAEKLNPESGNALLKSLEEPPSYALFILITEHLNQILPTIISRCQLVRFNPLSQSLIKDYLMKFLKFDENLAQSLAELAQGSLERAQRIAESGLIEELHSFIQAVTEKSFSQKLRIIERLAKQDKEKLDLFLYLLSLWVWSSYLKGKTEDFYPQAFPDIIYQGDPKEAFNTISRALYALEYFINKELTLLLLSQKLFGMKE